MIVITEVILKEILGEAFEAGWYGSKDMKESVVDNITRNTISRLMHQRPFSDTFADLDNTLTLDTVDWSSNPMDSEEL